MTMMRESDKSGQRLLLAAINIGAARNARNKVVKAYSQATEEYRAAFDEYVQIMEGQ